jgi:hypothetical protein
MDQNMLAGLIGFLLGAATPAWLFAQRLTKAETILLRLQEDVGALLRQRGMPE